MNTDERLDRIEIRLQEVERSLERLLTEIKTREAERASAARVLAWLLTIIASLGALVGVIMAKLGVAGGGK